MFQPSEIAQNIIMICTVDNRQFPYLNLILPECERFYASLCFGFSIIIFFFFEKWALIYVYT